MLPLCRRTKSADDGVAGLRTGAALAKPTANAPSIMSVDRGVSENLDKVRLISRVSLRQKYDPQKSILINARLEGNLPDRLLAGRNDPMCLEPANENIRLHVIYISQ